MCMAKATLACHLSAQKQPLPMATLHGPLSPALLPHLPCCDLPSLSLAVPCQPLDQVHALCFLLWLSLAPQNSTSLAIYLKGSQSPRRSIAGHNWHPLEEPAPAGNIRSPTLPSPDLAGAQPVLIQVLTLFLTCSEARGISMCHFTGREVRPRPGRTPFAPRGGP